MSNQVKFDNRRQFLKGWLRAILFGGIVFTGGLLRLREKPASGGDAGCTFELPCETCEKRVVCTDPKAVNQKRISK
ncbi:hypothetical protein ACFL6H_03725 [Candidatus Latescibacterota bacterium]